MVDRCTLTSLALHTNGLGVVGMEEHRPCCEVLVPMALSWPLLLWLEVSVCQFAAENTAAIRHKVLGV